MRELELIEKWEKLSNVKQGSKVSLTNGDIAEFVRLKQKKFIGIINGGSYDIPVGMFVEVVEEAKENTEYLNLKKGEYFYITNAKNDALLFTFAGIQGEHIIGINPISKTKTKIHSSLYKGRIA